ncbi:MAG: hypothetical protein Q7K21_07235 [Elusimicrobiota bacterium]|nr:hypothetical protein [Elusimicrobiota bacterium]
MSHNITYEENIVFIWTGMNRFFTIFFVLFFFTYSLHGKNAPAAYEPPKYEKFILKNKVIDYGVREETLLKMYGAPDSEREWRGDIMGETSVGSRTTLIYSDLMVITIKNNRVARIYYQDDDFADEQKELRKKFRTLYEQEVLIKLGVKFEELSRVLREKNKTEILQILPYHQVPYSDTYNFYFDSAMMTIRFRKGKGKVSDIRVKKYYEAEPETE